MTFIQKNHRVIFFFSWFLINFLQAAFTGLMDDEAYYWVYSQYPAWGYFDHPPMIAWLIKLGGWLFNGPLGVRFFIVLLNTLTIVLIGKLLERKDDKLYFTIALSLMLAQIGGIIAVPDLPLLFFATLYFLLYKRFAERTNILNAILLGAGIALMLYSKYHGILLVFFTLLSNIKLFTKYQTYIVAVVAVLLLMPHILWQIDHDLPSVQYHLFERNASEYKIGFTTEYILGQIALAGPIVGWLLLYAAFSKKPSTISERALKFSLVGIYVFFLLSTFKGRVEANWTVPAFVALIVISHQWLIDQEKWKKILFRLLPVTIVIVVAVRIFLFLDIERVQSISKDEFHGNEEWVTEVKSHAGNTPVVFLDSYQSPSKYMFYSGGLSMALNTPRYRRNNYNFWPIEDSLIGKKVLVAGRKDSILNGTFKNNYLKESGYAMIDNYYSFSKIQFTDLKLNDDKLTMLIKSPGNYLPYYQMEQYSNVPVYFAVITPDVGIEYIETGLTLKDIRSERQQVEIPYTIEVKEDQKVKIAVGASVGKSLNSVAIGQNQAK